jgi:heme exporter protein D
MKSLHEFFAMGGYAAYVWTSYALAAVVLAWNVIQPLRREKQVLRALAERARKRKESA